jgi:hypothetical protein
MAEAVEALKVEIDSQAAVPRVFDQPRKVAPVVQTVLPAPADPSWKGIAVVVPNVECK